jgi:hypothetical protein
VSAGSTGRAEGPQGGAGRAAPEQPSLAEAKFDRSLLPTLGVGEAEEYEGEIPIAPRVTPQRLHTRLIAVQLNVIGRAVV